MTALKKQTELSVSPETLNKNLKSTIRKIETELRTLYGGKASSTEIVFKTNGSFKYNELDSNTVNIHNHGDPNYLLKAYAMLFGLQQNHQLSVEHLKLKTYPVLVWYNYPVEDWLHDLGIRINLLLNRVRITELETAKKELEGFLSTEDRLVATLTKVSNALKK